MSGRFNAFQNRRKDTGLLSDAHPSPAAIKLDEQPPNNNPQHTPSSGGTTPTPLQTHQPNQSPAQTTIGRTTPLPHSTRNSNSVFDEFDREDSSHATPVKSDNFSSTTRSSILRATRSSTKNQTPSVQAATAGASSNPRSSAKRTSDGHIIGQNSTLLPFFHQLQSSGQAANLFDDAEFDQFSPPAHPSKLQRYNTNANPKASASNHNSNMIDANLLTKEPDPNQIVQLTTTNSLKTSTLPTGLQTVQRSRQSGLRNSAQGNSALFPTTQQPLELYNQPQTPRQSTTPLPSKLAHTELVQQSSHFQASIPPNQHLAPSNQLPQGQHNVQNQLQELQQQLRQKETEIAALKQASLDDRVEVIRLLRQEVTNHQAQMEESLHSRRKKFGRIVHVDDPQFGSGHVEMWYNGVEFDEKLRLVGMLEAKEAQLTATLKYLKSLQKESSKDDERVSSTSPATKRATSKKTTSTTKDNEKLERDGVLEMLTPYGFFSNNPPSDPQSPVLLNPFQLQVTFDVKLKEVREQLEKANREVYELEIQKKKLIHDERLFLHDQMSSLGKDDRLYGGDRYMLLWMLGKGGFSEVFAAYDLHTRQYCACKVHRLLSNWNDKKRSDYITKAQRECDIQIQIHHPHIVRLHTVILAESSLLMLILEKCNGGDLDQLLKQKGKLSEIESVPIMLQVLYALNYLKFNFNADQTVIHYDLKPANILFHDGVVKISDFGLSKVPQKGLSSIDLTSQGAGTLDYQPPECFKKGAQINHAVDMWACGVILYQMLYGRRPFDQTTITAATSMSAEKFKAEVVDQIRYRPDDASSSWKMGDLLSLCSDFISSCLEYDPYQRLTVENALKHPLFNFPLTPKGIGDAVKELSKFKAEIAHPSTPLYPQSVSPLTATEPTLTINSSGNRSNPRFRSVDL